MPAAESAIFGRLGVTEIVRLIYAVSNSQTVEEWYGQGMIAITPIFYMHTRSSTVLLGWTEKEEYSLNI